MASAPIPNWLQLVGSGAVDAPSEHRAGGPPKASVHGGIPLDVLPILCQGAGTHQLYLAAC